MNTEQRGWLTRATERCRNLGRHGYIAEWRLSTTGLTLHMEKRSPEGYRENVKEISWIELDRSLRDPLMAVEARAMEEMKRG